MLPAQNNEAVRTSRFICISPQQLRAIADKIENTIKSTPANHAVYYSLTHETVLFYEPKNQEQVLISSEYKEESI